jgi:hypothetical protein
LACLLWENVLEPLVFSDWLVKIVFFVGKILNSRIAFILGRLFGFATSLQRKQQKSPGAATAAPRVLFDTAPGPGVV